MSSKEWSIYKIGDLCQITSSKRIFSEEYIDRGIPFYRSKEIIEKALGDNVSEVMFISETRFRQIKDDFGAPKAGDILLSSVGNRSGIPYLVKEDDGDFYFKDGNLTWFKDFDTTLHSGYLYHWLRSPIGQNALNSIMIGSAQKALTIVGLSNLSIDLPPLPTQRRIAAILSALDDKIELNRQTNVTLEEMAQAIFREWFVAFRYPVSYYDLNDAMKTMRAGGNTHSPSKNQKNHSADMVESELGLIPRGWRVGRLGEIYKTSSGGTPSRNRNEYYENGVYQWVKSKELNGTFVIETEEKITDDALKNSSAKLLPKHSVLIAMYGATVGQVGIISSEATTNQAICAFIPNQNYPFSFVYQFLKNNKDDIIARAVGSAQQNISQELLRSLELVIPDASITKKYHAMIEPLFLAIEANIKQSATLAALRDTLLPKLMRGEVEV